MIGRRDLGNGYSAVQAMHAAIQFQHEHPELSRIWHTVSNYLGFLEVADEPAMVKLIERAEQHGIRYSIFREPDIGNAITAIALEPGAVSKKLCSNLRLALKDK